MYNYNRKIMGGRIMKSYGIIRVAAGVNRLKIADPLANAQNSIELIKKAKSQKVQLLVLPELNITGYTCADLFFQEQLLKRVDHAVELISEETKGYNGIVYIGIPYLYKNRLYNCALAIQNGKYLGLAPKQYIPNNKEFYEKRWFTSGDKVLEKTVFVEYRGQNIPFGRFLLEDSQTKAIIGAEICEDLWAPIPPSSILALNGANIIVNLSASNELVAKSEYRRDLVKNQSARLQCAYIYSSSGVDEATNDVVFGGDTLIFENGRSLAIGERFKRESFLTIADVDVEQLNFERMSSKTFADCSINYELDIERVIVKPLVEIEDLKESYRTYDKNPFVPGENQDRAKRCREIFEIQSSALAKRLEHIGSPKAVIGISGGLDSTLALLVVVETFKKLKRPLTDIVGITMPGFGTTDRTYDNAIDLMKSLGITHREVDIKKSVRQHFDDINHDESIHDITYENCQARERTQILMDVSNQVKGLVIGTGDLSEVALGWSTYNGDHMSMYAVNVSVPKTLIQYVVRWVLEERLEENESKKVLERALRDILDTPISPELLPPDETGNIKQKTEDTVGPYILHDFFLYHTVRGGVRKEKLRAMALKTFQEDYKPEIIDKWLNHFYRRFFTQQFKRTCIPDGPKVGSVSLSPRGDWRMATDSSFGAWMD
jgi:NAD+ synthase (glutamine-hydrolysing)